jgi:hypothetical protein
MKTKKVGKVLAEGETTGHAHRLLKTEVLEREDGMREFEVGKDGDTVSHEEHGKIDLAPKKYNSDRVIEFDFFAEEAKRVQD